MNQIQIIPTRLPSAILTYSSTDWGGGGGIVVRRPTRYTTVYVIINLPYKTRDRWYDLLYIGNHFQQILCNLLLLEW